MNSSHRFVKALEMNIVVVGSFNPSIFQPAWLKSEGFITQSELDSCNIEIIHSDIAKFTFPGFLIQVLREQLHVAATDQRYFEALRDLVVNIFSSLDRTPIKFYGINYNAHFNVETEEAWHKIGNFLTPKEFWSNFLEGTPGMRTIVIESKNKFNPNGYIRTKVEPSPLLSNGVYVQVNNHFVPEGDNPLKKVSSLVDNLKTNWEDVISISSNIVDKVKEIK